MTHTIALALAALIGLGAGAFAETTWTAHIAAQLEER